MRLGARLTLMLRYLWAGPVTVAALLFVPLAWLTGGRARLVSGVVEVEGGLIAWLLRRIVSASAMTFGHVILGCDRPCLERCRSHEHVRQYERWGIFMLPIYLTASLVLYLRGLDPYRDNPFEREAFDREKPDCSN